MDKVREWLTSAGLGQYGDTFEENGWDDMETLCTMSIQDIQELVTKPGHIRKLTIAIKHLNEQQYKETPIENSSNQSSTDAQNISYHSAYNDKATVGATNAISVHGSSEIPEIISDVCVGVSSGVIVRLPRTTELTGRHAVVAKLDRISASSISTSTIVKDSHNVTIADKVEVHNVHQESRQPHDNFKAQIKTVLCNYEKTSDLYVKTKAYREVTDVLEDNNWVIIEGNPGYGKSTMAKHQMMEHSKLGYEPIIATSTGDWKSMVEGKSKDSIQQIVLIDDIFGSGKVDERKVDEWHSMIEIIEKLLKERDGCLKVICTTRKYTLSKVLTQFKRFKLFSKLHTVDLTAEIYGLSESEKIDMLIRYFKQYKINLDNEFVKSVASLKSEYGFPHCVEMFSKSSTLRERGLAFFKTPLELLENEFENLAEFETKKYCSLLMVLLAKNNKFDANVLENETCKSTSVSNALKLSRLPADTHLPDFVHSFKLLNDVFIKEIEDGIYTFKHDSFKEIVSIVTFKRNPKRSIELSELNFLVGNTRYFGYKLCPSEIAVVLPKYCNESLCQRLTDEILAGNGDSILEHQAWDDMKFVSSWLQFIKTIPNKCTLDIIMQKRDRKCGDYTFLSSLCLMQKEEALKVILQDGEFKNKSQNAYYIADISFALICATLNICSEDILEILLSLGADINISFTVHQVEQYCKNRFWSNMERSYRIFKNLIGLGLPLAFSIYADDIGKTMFFIRKGASLFMDGILGKSMVHIAAEYGSVSCLRYILGVLNTLKIPQINDQTSTFENVQYIYGENYVEYFCNLKAQVNRDFLDMSSHPSRVYFMKPVHMSRNPEIVNILCNEYNNKIEPLTVLWSTCFNLLDTVKSTDSLERASMPILMYMFINEILTPCLVDQLCQLGVDVNDTFLDKPILFFEITHEYESSDQRIELLQALYENGLDIDLHDLTGKTALSYILCSEGYDFRSEILNWLLDKKADPNIADNDNCVPLCYALQHYDGVEIISRLINDTSNLQRAISNKGQNCLHFLAGNDRLSSESIQEIIELLLLTNIDINQLDSDGNPPLIFTDKGTIELFLKNGAYQNIQDKNGRTFAMRLLVYVPDNANNSESLVDDFDYQDDVNCDEELRWFNENDLLQILIDNGMDVAIKDEKARNILFYVMQSNLFKEKMKLHIINTHLKQICDFNQKDADGITPAMLAVRSRTCGRELFIYLIQNGMNVSQTDTSGRSILDHCLESKIDDTIKATLLSTIVSSRGFKGIQESSIPYALTDKNGEQTIEIFFNNVILNESNNLSILKSIINSEISNVPKLMAIKVCLERMDGILSFKNKIDINMLLKTFKNKEMLQLFIRHRLIDNKMFTDGFELVLLPDDDHDASEVLSILHAEGINVEKIYMSPEEDLIEMKLIREKRLFTLKYLIRYWDKKRLSYRDSNGNSILHYLALADSEDRLIADIINHICRKTRNIEVQNLNGETPLHAVCQATNLKLQTLFLMTRNCTNVNIADNSGMTVMHHLINQHVYISETSAEEKEAILVYALLDLIEHGAKVDLQDNSGLTPVMYLLGNVFVNRVVGAVEVLMNSVSDWSKHDCHGNTILHLLCWSYLNDNAKQHFVEILLQKGAMIDTINNKGFKPVEVYVGILSVKLVHALQNKAEHEKTAISNVFNGIEWFDDFQNYPEQLLNILTGLNIAVNTQSTRLGITFLSQSCRFYKCPLIVEALLNHGASPNVCDDRGYTSLHCLLFSGRMMFLSLLKSFCFNEDMYFEELLFQLRNRDQFEFPKKNLLTSEYTKIDTHQLHESIIKDVSAALHILHMLLSNNADPNQMDNKGRTPLHYCAKSPTVDGFTCVAMKMLISFGADVNVEDYKGQTPLMLCAEFEGTKYRRMNILIEAGADVFAVDYNGESVPDHAKTCIAKRIQRQMELDIVEDRINTIQTSENSFVNT